MGFLADTLKKNGYQTQTGLPSIGQGTQGGFLYQSLQKQGIGTPQPIQQIQPEQPAPVVQPPQQSFFQSAASGIGNLFSTANNYVQQFSNAVFPKLGGNAIIHPLDTLKSIENNIQGGAEQLGQKLIYSAGAVQENFQNNSSWSKKAGSVVDLLTTAASSVLFPVSETFTIASNLPVIKPAADAVGLLFEKTGQLGGFTASKLLDTLPISQQAKTDLQQPINDAGSLLGQVTLGGYVYSRVTGLLENKGKITPADEKIIVQDATQKAQEVKAQPQTFQSPQVEAPKIEPSPLTDISKQAQEGVPKTAQEAAQRYYDEVVKPEISQGKAIVLGADNMKDYFGNDYADSRHPVYSNATFKLYNDLLKENRSPEVRFTVGGPGSGKTELVTNNLAQGFDGIVYDSNFADYAGAVKQIEAAKNAGKTPKLYVILKDPALAAEHVAVREAATGRGVSESAFVRGHTNAPDVARRLIENKVVRPEDVQIFDIRGLTSRESISNAFQGVSNTDKLSMLQDALDNNPAWSLWKYANKKTGELPEMTGGGKSVFGKMGDQKLSELYGYDVTEQQVLKDFEDAKKIRAEIKAIQKENDPLAILREVQYNKEDVKQAFQQSRNGSPVNANTGVRAGLVSPPGERGANQGTESNVSPGSVGLLPENNAPRNIELTSGFNPNLDKFIEQDVKPTLADAVGSVTKTWDFIKKTITPALRGEEARTAASIIRESLGQMARRKEIIFESLNSARKTLDAYTPEKSIQLIDSIETGKPLEGFDQFSKVVRQALDSRWKQIQEIKGTSAYIENYFPHIWKDPAKAEGVMAQFFGKRPLEGTKSYLKQRTIPTTKEGIALGLEPISYNPVDLVFARIADMDRFIMADKVWSDFKSQGLRKFVRFGDKPPEGWKMVDDKISRVFQFSEKEKAMIVRGNWYLPEQAATVLDNYLSRGLRGNPIYDGFRMVGNTLNQVQLGLSGFHAFFTSGDAVISKAALEIQKAFGENVPLGERVTSIGKALATPVTAPYTLFMNIIRGNKLLTDYFKENPQVPELVNALERSGGRVRMDSFYLNNSVENFMKSLRGGNYIGSMLRAPGAIIETMSKPIMEYLVPRQKLGIFADSAMKIMDEAKRNDWSEAKTTLRLQEMWDSVDNRMGQLVYDNLFWQKTLKDLGMASVRSLGWNIGTIRELGGGATELVSAPVKALFGKDVRMTPKMAYTIALPYVVGLWGAITYYGYNGTAPQELLDYYYPKTGKKKPNGDDERITLPSYMKDVFAYKTEPFQTVLNKVHPEIATLIDMMQNQDYYGGEIRNPEDPFVKQLQDIVKYQASQYVPFSITNLIQRKNSGDGWTSYLQSFAGITPAPGYITRTPLQTKISELYDRRMGGGVRSQEEVQNSKAKSEIRTLYLQGKTDEANAKLKEAVNAGIVKDTKQFIQDADIPPDIKLFRALPASDQEDLLKTMKLYELNRYAWYTTKDVKSRMSTLSPTTKDFVELFKRGDVKPPEWSKGQLVAQ